MADSNRPIRPTANEIESVVIFDRIGIRGINRGHINRDDLNGEIIALELAAMKDSAPNIGI